MFTCSLELALVRHPYFPHFQRYKEHQYGISLLPLLDREGCKTDFVLFSKSRRYVMRHYRICCMQTLHRNTPPAAPLTSCDLVLRLSLSLCHALPTVLRVRQGHRRRVILFFLLLLVAFFYVCKSAWAEPHFCWLPGFLPHIQVERCERVILRYNMLPPFLWACPYCIY